VGDTLICPKCHERLWVGQMQIPLLTCPGCLGLIVNPNAASGVHIQQTPRARAGLEPRQVIPLEEEVGFDLRGTVAGLVVLGLVLSAGGLAAFLLLKQPRLGVVLVGAAMMVGGGVMIANRRANAQPEISAAGPARDGSVLEYQRSGAKLPFIQQPRPQVSVLAFLGGFIMAIVIGIICFYAMVVTGERTSVTTRRLVFAGMAAVIVGLIFAALQLRKTPGWTGFGRGVAIGLALAMMALGPCAACYVLTLFA